MAPAMCNSREQRTSLLEPSPPLHFYRKLGHNDSFCPVRLQRDVDKLDLGWDISLRVSRRKATTMESIGLRKRNMKGLQGGSSHDWRDNRNINNRPFVNALGKVNPMLGVNLEGDGAGF
ncbi:hypothetical protein GOBAR_DD09906 [Gossypium barbadense]|nr:hypothetical protein GOBAR_DD09906 [Gossypium barbadense]